MNGINSLLNEAKYSFKRGQRIKYIDRFGKECRGTYVMASSADDYVVLNVGGAYGRPAVVHIDAIV